MTLAVLIGGAALAVGYLRLRATDRLAGLHARLRPVARAAKILTQPMGAALFALSLLTWLAEGSIFWLVAQSLEVGLGPAEAVAVVILASLSALVPAGLGYVGTYDAAALFALAQVDVRAGAALSCVLLFRFVVFVPITLVGLLLLLTRYRGANVTANPEREAATVPAPA